MLAAALIVFREVLEAGLIVGVVLAATEGVARRGRWVSGGIAAGLIGAGLVALFAQQLSDAFAGQGQDLFNAAILIAAVAMLGWHVVWMSRHARAMTAQLRALGDEVASGQRTLFAMAVVVAVAILREGAEVVLFLYGLASGDQGAGAAIPLGGALGVAVGALCAFLLYRGLLAIPAGKLFAVTGALVVLLAAGMAGQAAALLARADLVPALGQQVWDTSAILRDDSLIGRSLHALMGYSDRPMGIQLIAWLTVAAGLWALARITRKGAAAIAP